MRKVTWGENETAYDAVVNALFGDEKWAVGTYLVQIKIKDTYKPDDKFEDLTEILYADGDKFEWHNDWWEGQGDVIITGFAEVDDVDISVSFPFN